jgi:hypothetical protein
MSTALADEIVRLIQMGVHPDDAVAEAIVSLVKSSLNSKKNIRNVFPPQTTGTLINSLGNNRKANTAKLILKLIQNSVGGQLKKETAEAVVKHAGPPNSNAVLKVIVNSLGPPEKAPEIKNKIMNQKKPVTNNTANLIYRIIANLFKTNGKMAEGPAPRPNFVAAATFRQSNRPKNGRKWYFGTVKNVGTGWHLNKGPAQAGPTGRPNSNKMAEGPAARPNFVPASTFRQANRPKNGRKWYFGTVNGVGTGWHLNKGAIQAGPVAGPAGRPNFSVFDLAALLKWRRENPRNTANVNSAISKLLKKHIEEVRYSSSSSERLARLSELLRQLPINFSGRREIVTMIIAMIRDISNMNRFSNFMRNLRGINNRNIRDALETQRRRLERRPGESYERRMPSRYPGESNSNYRSRSNTNAIRRAIARSEPPRAPRVPNYGPGPAAPPISNENAIRRALGGGPPPPLPPSQNAAINAVGGPNKAIQKVALVPGGAAEVAKAAEALNETGGNVRLALNTRGVSPAAIKAVQNLGGVSQTVKILEGLNTMAQTPATRRLKAARPRVRRPKKSPVRLTELNRVIAAVKKQKLISLMAHNITRTNNIHPNDEKLKTYYKKVMKSYLLKKPFANIAKRAAKKRVR